MYHHRRLYNNQSLKLIIIPVITSTDDNNIKLMTSFDGGDGCPSRVLELGRILILILIIPIGKYHVPGSRAPRLPNW